MKMNVYLTKTICLSIVAIVIFFVPISGGATFLVLLCTAIKNAFSGYRGYILLMLVLFWLIRKIRKKKSNITAVFQILLTFFCAGTILLDMNNCSLGGKKLYWILTEVNSLAFTVVITVSVSGIFSVFVTNSGLVEFIAIFAESIMKPVLKLPGYAAVDILTSFAASSSVGVYITDKYYREGRYSLREACFLVSNFSVVSLGFMYFIISAANLNQYSLLIIGCVILLNLMIGAVMVRINPIKKIEDALVHGKPRSKCMEVKQTFSCKFQTGVDRACRQAKNFNLKAVIQASGNSLVFGTGIIMQVVPIYFITLFLLNYTSLFEICSKPIGWLLNVFGVPEAYNIAPGTFLGIFEVSMPVIYISQIALPLESRFFITVLSLVQIIFFTETANAITQSSIFFKISDMIKIFFIRTILAVPLILLIIEIVF